MKFVTFTVFIKSYNDIVGKASVYIVTIPETAAGSSSDLDISNIPTYSSYIAAYIGTYMASQQLLYSVTRSSYSNLITVVTSIITPGNLTLSVKDANTLSFNNNSTNILHGYLELIKIG